MYTTAMKFSLISSFALLAACAPGSGERAAAPEPKAASPMIIPVPGEFSAGSGIFRVDAATTVV